MPSFDIVSKTDLAEAGNAIANVTREMETRYDFKGSKSRIAINDAVIGNLSTSEPGKRREQVHRVHNLVTYAAGLDLGWPADRERYTQSPFVS